MKRTLRFLCQFGWIYLACLVGFALAITACAFLTGVPHGSDNLFSSYFGSYPVAMLLILYLFSIGLCTTYLNLAVSFGARRQDYFWGTQVGFLVLSGAAWVIKVGMTALSTAMNWMDELGEPYAVALQEVPGWCYLLMGMACMALGAVCGFVLIRSRVWGTIFMVVVMLAFITGVTVSLLISDGFLPLNGMMAGVVVVFVLCEGIIWRFFKRYSVR
jgi:hypothetical protein